MFQQSRKLIILISLALISVLCLGLGARAATRNQSVTVAQDQSYDGVFIRAASTIDISGKINGDAVVGASSVTIDGEITGDAYIAAQTVTIHGKVDGNLHVAAATVTISGKVGGSLMGAAATIDLTSDAQIGRSVLAAGSSLKINGSVAGSVYAAGSNLNINSSIGNDTTLAGSAITLASHSKIEGNLKYYSHDDAQIDHGATITGHINHVLPKTRSTSSVVAARVGTSLYGVVSGLLLIILLLFIVPRSTLSVTAELTKNPGRSFLAGVLAIIVTPIIIVALLITAIGMPIAILLGLIYVAVLVLGLSFFALWLGQTVLGHPKKPTWSNQILAAAVGLVLIALIRLLPIVGGLFSFVAFFFGVGAVVSRAFDRGMQSHRTQARL